MTDARIPLAILNEISPADFIAALEGIFEHSPWVAEAAEPGRPYATVATLHEAMMRAVRESPAERRLALIAAHPDLAGKAARAGAMAAASVSEQAGLGLDRLSDEDYEEFQALNAAYRARFGFPFIVCVRRQTREAVLAAYRRRLSNDREAEERAALDEIGHITRLRLVDTVIGPGMPAVAGHLSTHVLDTYHGEPAAGMAFALYEVGRDARARLLSGVTNANGRTDEPLIHGVPLRAGRYELVFQLADYFGRRGVALPAEPFLAEVVLRFGIDDPEGRYHVPLVATPWSYSTYRGS